MGETSPTSVREADQIFGKWRLFALTGSEQQRMALTLTPDGFNRIVTVLAARRHASNIS